MPEQSVMATPIFDELMAELGWDTGQVVAAEREESDPD